MAKRIPASVWLAASALGVGGALQTALALAFARRGQLGWGQFGFAALVAWADRHAPGADAHDDAPLEQNVDKLRHIRLRTAYK